MVGEPKIKMESETEWLGLDIGGANLKAATTTGWSEEIPFPLWKHPEKLIDQLKVLNHSGLSFDKIAVTMTGELCDCFLSKRQGVLHIVEAVETAFSGAKILYWTNQGGWVAEAVAREFPYDLAASNWLALAQFLSENFVDKPAVLVDMGSTTTDILFLIPGKVLCQGRDDPGRLDSGELVYTGYIRSPLCSLVQEKICTEVFATTLDAHLILGNLQENPSRSDSADGRAWTVKNAHSRIARMLGADLETSTQEERVSLANKAISTQWARIASGIQEVLERNGKASQFILGGQGAPWIGQRLMECNFTTENGVCYLRELWGEEGSRVACARAVAQMAKNHGSK